MHDAIRVFVGKRSSAPGDGENVLGVSPYGHVKSLHVGQARAATIYDPEQDVCWLLAYSGTHAIGERRDAYEHFMKLSRRDELLPDEGDYLALGTVTAASLMDEIQKFGGELLIEARENPGGEACRTLSLVDGDEVEIAVSIELVVEATDSAEQGWIAFVLPHSAPIEVQQLLDLVADMLPSYIRPEDIVISGDINGRPLGFAELAITWEHYS